MAATGSYKLDLESQKRNVFVTQLHERDDEDDIQAFPVVKESGDKLIETGLNSLQKTLLLKKEVEVDKVQTELEAKRHEFRERMESCAQKQIEVQKKQQKMKDRVAKFEKFIKENEAKRRRAIQKYQTEVKLKEQKTREYDLTLEQLEELRQRQKYLENKVARYKKYEEYLLRVIDAMPEDYLPATDDKIKKLMMRYRTLSESNRGLVDNLDTMADELEQLKANLDEIKMEQNKLKISINSQLGDLQHKHEKEQDENQQLETMFATNTGDLRARRTEIGVTLMAIDNIYEKCRKRLDPPLDKLILEEKLAKIKDYLNDQGDVVRMALPTESTRGESAKGSADIRAARGKNIKKKVVVNG